MHIDGLRGKLQRIATSTRRYEARRSERSAKLRHEALQTVARRRRGLRPPQPVDELVSRHRPTALQSQHHQECTQLGARDHDVRVVVVHNLELAEKADLHDSTVPGASASRLLDDPSILRGAQLEESPAAILGNTGVVDGSGQQFDDLVVSPEVGEVLERQVDGANHPATGTQFSKLVAISLTA